MDKAKQVKERPKRIYCEIPSEAVKILDVIKGNVRDFTWGAEDISYAKAIKIWARKTIDSGLYKIT